MDLYPHADGRAATVTSLRSLLMSFLCGMPEFSPRSHPNIQHTDVTNRRYDPRHESGLEGIYKCKVMIKVRAVIESC